MDYSHIVILHLVCAIFFGGAIFTEVFALAPLRRHMTEEEFRRIEFLLFRRIRRAYPVVLLPLYGTGFWMYAEHLGNAGGFADLLATRFGVLLTLKLCLALGVFGVFATAPFLFMPGAAAKGWRGWLSHFAVITGDETQFRTDRFDGLHWLAFSLVLGVVILAKAMYLA